MPAIVLQQVSSAFAQENAGKTLEKPFALKWLLRYVESEEERSSLAAACATEHIHAWGAKAERRHQFAKMPASETLVLFRRHKFVYGYGVIVAKLESEKAGEKLWGSDNDGQTWSLIFLLREFKRLKTPTLASSMNVHLNRDPSDNWQGLTAVVVPSDARLRAFFAEQAGDA